MTSLELILSEIPDFEKCRASRGTPPHARARRNSSPSPPPSAAPSLGRRTGKI